MAKSKKTRKGKKTTKVKDLAPKDAKAVKGGYLGKAGGKWID